jgi:ABC-type Fe3+-hydroxamate transport system substrate-binding protein
MDDVFNRFVLIGGSIGRKKQAAKLVASMRNQLAAIKQRAESSPKKRVYMEIDAGNWTIGGPSYLTEILKLAGAENVFGERPEPYLTVTMESIVSRNPDLILSLSRAKEEYQNQAAWKVLNAVREGKIIDKKAIDWNAITHQGSRLIEGIRQLEIVLRGL